VNLIKSSGCLPFKIYLKTLLKNIFEDRHLNAGLRCLTGLSQSDQALILF
jgi:hypothetical protein